MRVCGPKLHWRLLEFYNFIRYFIYLDVNTLLSKSTQTCNNNCLQAKLETAKIFCGNRTELLASS